MVAGLAAGISAISGLVGTAVSVHGSFQTAAAQKKAEKIREGQMRLEAARTRREQVRRAQAAAAKAKANAWNQGAGTSSALMGGVSQIYNEAGRNIVATNQDETLGAAMFKTNAQMAHGQLMSSLGSGISSLGGAIANVAGTVTKIGSGFKLPFMKEENA